MRRGFRPFVHYKYAYLDPFVAARCTDADNVVEHAARAAALDLYRHVARKKDAMTTLGNGHSEWV